MKVLLGVGGSDDSMTALEATVDRAVAAGDELTVAVVDNPGSDRSPETVTERVEETVAEASLDADVRRIEGHAGSRLVEIAEEEGFDQIAIGGGQTSPMGKINLGSIAEFVLLNAPVSVKLVRER
ncbi:MAG: universal stress protein [Halobaculum sp.]|jgi:nucleotide-binding universal stress UspA family protein